MKAFCGFLSYILIIAVAVVLTSCVSATVGRSFDPAGVSRLQVGSTTKAEAIRLFGAPTVSIETANWPSRPAHFGDANTALIWRYFYGHSRLFIGSSRGLQVEFDSKGILVDYHFQDESRGSKPNSDGDFDFYAARDRIVPGKTTQDEVRSLLGDRYAVVDFKQLGVAARWSFVHLERSKTEYVTFAGQRLKQTYGRSVQVDFGSQGIVLHVQGESDFPQDLGRQ